MKMETNKSGKESIVNAWKEKALMRGKQFKLQNKKIREVTHSRDHWKAKYFKIKDEKDLLLFEIRKIKKKLNEIIN